jgi:hypothetical protein
MGSWGGAMGWRMKTGSCLRLSAFQQRERLHQMVSIVHAGLATAKPTFAAGRPSGATWIQISKTDRRALRNFGCSVDQPRK